MKCKECLNEDWECVLGYVREEEGRFIHLFQCKNCKRVIVADDDIEFAGGTI